MAVDLQRHTRYRHASLRRRHKVRHADGNGDGMAHRCSTGIYNFAVFAAAHISCRACSEIRGGRQGGIPDKEVFQQEMAEKRDNRN